MKWLGKLISSGYTIESVVSKQPGFELVTLIDTSSGERVLYWRRSSRITVDTVRHLLRLVNIRVDRLFIEFTDRPEIDKDAEQELRKHFPKIEIRTSREISEKTDHIPDTLELYGGDVTIIKLKKSRGSLRLHEHDRVLQVMDRLDDRTLWILVIELTKDGKLRIIDDYKNNWKHHTDRVTLQGSRIVILAIWHGQYTTDIFLLYPHPHHNNSTTT